MKPRVLLLAALLALLVAPSAARAVGTLDQQQTNTSSYYFVEGPQVSPFKSGFSLAQTFTAGLSGGLDRVDLPLRRRAQTTLPVNIQITSVEVGGAPNNLSVLASTTVPANAIPTSGTGFVAITFTAPAPVVAGTQYAIVAFTADPAEGAYEWGGSTPNALTGNVYASGEPWATVTSPPTTWTREVDRGFVFDLGFKTYVTPTLKTATCGKTTVGSTSDTLLSNVKRVNKCVLPANAEVSELTVYLAPTSTQGQQLIKGIIYADSKGTPGARIGVTEQFTFKSTNSAGWYRLRFSPPLKVEAGTYWIGIITGATSHVAGERYDSVANAEDYNSNSYSAGPSNPFGSFKTTNEEMSLYATYAAGQTCSSIARIACF
jgi:hypothetical protein